MLMNIQIAFIVFCSALLNGSSDVGGKSEILENRTAAVQQTSNFILT